MHAWITHDTRTLPALIIDWTRHVDANGYPHDVADCCWVEDGQIVRGIVPRTRVRLRDAPAT